MPSRIRECLMRVELFGDPGPKRCCCGDTSLCCDGRCSPYVNETFPGDCTGGPSDNPLPTQLTVEMTSDSPYGCWEITATASFIEPIRWAGRLTGSCTFCCPGNSAANCTWYFDFLFQIQCAATQGWLFEWDEVTSPPLPMGAIPPNFVLTRVSCDPILLTGEVCYNPGMICSGLMPPIGNGQSVTHPTLCLSFTISETL